MNTQYVVAKGHIVWHSKEEKHYYADEMIDLSHLTPQAVAEVLASGAVVEKPVEKVEVKKKEKAVDVS